MQKETLILVAITLAATICSASAHRRIYGGWYVEIEQFPWQILMLTNGKPACGGSIVSDYYVLTAAHCVHNQTGVKSHHIVYGTKTPLQKGSGTKVRVISFEKHTGYTGTEFNNHDIAVLKLERPVIFSNKARAISLRSVEARPNEIVFLSGWGTTWNDMNAQPSEYLLAVNTTIMERTKCFTRIFGWVPDYAVNIICSHVPFKSGCKGDSGGAVVAGSSQVGVVASGKKLGCGDYYTPEVHVNVVKYKSFIDTATQNTATWTTN